MPIDLELIYSRNIIAQSLTNLSNGVNNKEYSVEITAALEDLHKELLETRREIKYKLYYLKAVFKDYLKTSQPYDFKQQKNILKLQEEISQKGWKYKIAITEYSKTIEEIINQKLIDFIDWKIQQERELAYLLRNINITLQKQLSEYQFPIQLGIVEEKIQHENYSNILLTAHQILQNKSLTVVLSQIHDLPEKFPKIQKDLESHLIELTNYYSKLGRTVNLIIVGSSNYDQYHQEIVNIHGLCNSNPVIILDPQVENDFFYLSSHFWGSNWHKIKSNSILNRLSWIELQIDLVKREVFTWLTLRRKSINSQEIDQMYGSKINLLKKHYKILSREKIAHRNNIDINSIDRPYKITSQELQKAGQILVRLQQIYTALLIDEYYILHAPTEEPVTPIAYSLLPEILPELPSFIHRPIIKGMLDFYHVIYHELELQQLGILILKLSLALVESLLNIDYKELAKQEVQYSVKYYLKLKGVTNISDDKLLDVFQSLLTIHDQDYIQQVNHYLANLDWNYKEFNIAIACYNRGLQRYQSQDYEMSLVDLDMAIELNPNYTQAYYVRALSHYVLQYYDETIQDLTQVIKLSPNWKEAYFYRGEAYYFLTQYDLALADFHQAVNLGYTQAKLKSNFLEQLISQINQGALKPVKPIRKQKPKVQEAEIAAQRQALAIQKEAEKQEKRQQGLIYSYDLVLLNSDGTEKYRETREQEVAIREFLPNGNYIDMIYIVGNNKIKPFLIGKYPVTQSQWEAIMKCNPSHFIGDDLPVEQISWDDANQYCVKLNQLIKSRKRTFNGTSYSYRLPTEAEWELACRAGTTTQFHFGNAINHQVANYNYNIGKTTPVGSFGVANAFGLFDMNGNVWEWCEDIYSNNSNRIIRGGGWYDSSILCASSFRHWRNATFRNILIGFRLAILLE